ncbi:3-hydroxyacyl-CoA dehydrogenase type-2 isoform X1 [Lasioglossum baleicum]|uniref:3-hydroxyacyl-CoA dehydrogenase type-2 isoform X1 n=1 Tax=Lasioglossum baleicum TaxID=434251 RepID=UPI003FCD6202
MAKMQHIVAYITGGAHGIGKAVAEKIYCQGGKVVLADISCTGIKVAESLGDRALFSCTDVRAEKDVMESIKCVKEKFGGVNVLVNAAGMASVFPVYDFKKKKPHSMDAYRCMFDTNVWGVFNVTRLMAPLMAENKPDAHKQRGVIINLSSSMACEAPPEFVVYGGSKAAVAGMTMPMARGLAQKGIRVVGVCPGYIDSPMTGKTIDSYLSSPINVPFLSLNTMILFPLHLSFAFSSSAPQKPEIKKRNIQMMLTPRRYGCCEEVAHLIQACIENPLINGNNIRIDMGYRYNQTDDGQKDDAKSS